ncbi:Nardilysin, partial [Trachymyrmex cornetzi]
KFRAIRLPNGLEALLISEKNLSTSSSQDKKAACSLCVDVGSFSDPPEFPGISYFFEYMLFREFDKRLELYNFGDYIYSQGGTYRVSVDSEHTTFYFNIKENKLFLSLRSFGLFFIEPIIPKHKFMEQLDEIKNEFQKNLYNGRTRYEQLFFSSARTGHPANKFSEDHLIKLRNNIDYDKLYDVLHKFKERHYSAHRMKIAIRSGLPLDVMEKFVEASFDNVPNNGKPRNKFSKFKNDLPFDTPAFRKMYKVKNDVALLTRLIITWALPSFSDFYKCNSHQYIPCLFEYKGKGSLTSYLHQKMWSPILNNNVIYCSSQQNSLYSLIYINIFLTTEGRRHLEDILGAIFSFINLLKKEGPQKAIYNDIYESEKNIFRFANYDEEPISTVKQLSKNMHFYPPKAYLTGDKLNSNYNAEVIQKCLNYLAPEMANVMIYSKDFNDSELTKVQPCWQTAYTDIEIPKEWIERWKVIEPLPELFLPLPNILLTKNPCLIQILKEQTEKYPIKLYCNPVSEIWYRYDPKFHLPKCCMHFHFISPLKLQSLKNGVLMDMYCILQLSSKELYPALLAGFEYHIDVTENGYTLRISGPNETLPDITLKDFQDFVKSFTKSLYIQCLVQGNMTPPAAIKIVQQFIKTINCSPIHPNTIEQLRGTQIPLGISYYKIKNINKLDTTSIITNYYQAGVKTIELSTSINLIGYIMADKLHEGLPVNKFTHATVNVKAYNGIVGLLITVSTQAHKYTTEYVDKKIDEFLRWFKNDLEKLTEEELDGYKEMFLKSKLHDDANLKDEVERNWKEIVNSTYIFDLHEQEILALKKINVNKLTEWLADHTSKGSNFRKLSLQVVGAIPKTAKYVGLEYVNDDHQQRKPSKYHYITKVEDYKKKLFMFPTKRSFKLDGVLMRMYCRLLKQLLTEELYPALLAGFKYNIRVLLNGFTVKMSGPSATLPLLATSFAQVMERYSSVITKDIYNSIKIQQMQTWYYCVSKPEIFIGDMTLSILKLVHHSHIDMHTTIRDITLKDFQDFVKSFTESLYIKCLVQGNMTPRVAIETVQQFTKTINCSPLDPNTIRQLRGTQIPLGISYYKIKNINKLDTTSIIRNYYQAGVITIELSTLISLIGIIMDHKLHEGLPVNKFTNATVNVGAYNGIVGFSITVCTQAHKYTTEYVDKKIDEFLRKFKDDLEKLTEEELDVYKEMFLKSRSYDDANIEDERNWNDILNDTYIFNLYEQEILILKEINVKKLWEWIADHTSNGTNFRKLSLHVVGTIPKRAKYVGLEYIYDYHQQYEPNKNHYITKVKDYKKKLSMFPTKRSKKFAQNTE